MSDSPPSQADLGQLLSLDGKVAIVTGAAQRIGRESGGAIVNISSVHAFHVSDGYVTYQTAKAGVVHFTRQVAWDFGPEKIRCNCICPGDIPLPSEVDAYANDPGYLEERTLLKAIKRSGHPRDIARAALFLVSDLAEWITGQALTVDGGEHLTFPMVGAQRMERLLELRAAHRA